MDPTADLTPDIHNQLDMHQDAIIFTRASTKVTVLPRLIQELDSQELGPQEPFKKVEDQVGMMGSKASLLDTQPNSSHDSGHLSAHSSKCQEAESACGVKRRGRKPKNREAPREASIEDSTATAIFIKD